MFGNRDKVCNKSVLIFYYYHVIINFQTLPTWMKQNPGVIQTGNDTVDQIISVLVSTEMFLAGALGFFLDNTVPGK